MSNSLERMRTEEASTAVRRKKADLGNISIDGGKAGAPQTSALLAFKAGSGLPSFAEFRHGSTVRFCRHHYM